MSSLVGKTLGPYRVIALVGQGAMAAVYRAEHTGLGREVALKVPHMGTRVVNEDIARFRREGKLLASVTHSGVIQILDADEIDGVPFLAMTFVEAPTLEAVLAACPEGKLTEKRVIAITRSLLEALEAIHERGIVHRDLKPSNVFVETGDRAILADFGVARPLGEHTMITADGAAVGTFIYMAPEQHVEEPVDARTDLYVTGLMMYRMLCGKLPFDGNMVQVMSAKCEQDHLESPRTFAPEVSLALEAVLRRACSRKPGERFQSAAEFRAALKAVAQKPGATQPNPRGAASKKGLATGDLPAGARRTSRQRKRVSAVLVVVGAFSVGALLAVITFRSNATSTPWVRLEDSAKEAHSSSASAPPPVKRLPPRPRAQGTPLNMLEAQEQMVALWPGYTPTALEADLTRFPMKPNAREAERETRARELLARLGNTVGGVTMRELAERGLVFPAFLPFMIPGAQAPTGENLHLSGGGSEGLLDAPLYDLVGKSTPQTALSMFLSCAARVTDYIVNVRVGRRPPGGVTTVDLIAYTSYLAMTQPGWHTKVGEQAYALFTPEPGATRITYENGSEKDVTTRARAIDAICQNYFRERAR